MALRCHWPAYTSSTPKKAGQRTGIRTGIHTMHTRHSLFCAALLVLGTTTLVVDAQSKGKQVDNHPPISSVVRFDEEASPLLADEQQNLLGSAFEGISWDELLEDKAGKQPEASISASVHVPSHQQMDNEITQIHWEGEEEMRWERAEETIREEEMRTRRAYEIRRARQKRVAAGFVSATAMLIISMFASAFTLNVGVSHGCYVLLVRLMWKT